MDKLEIQITQDFICPWCWIGEQKLKDALVAEDAASTVRLDFMPYELKPGMAKRGMDRKQYRSTKFGRWSRSPAIDAHVADAGRDAVRSVVEDDVSLSEGKAVNRQMKTRALVIGGLLGGVFAATELRGSGWDVSVFERSPNDLGSRGGGIVLQPEVVAAINNAGIQRSGALGVLSRDRVYLDREGVVLHATRMPQTQTSWNTLYANLIKGVPEEYYHRGEKLVAFEQVGQHGVARFESGREEEGDLLIGADGGEATVRSILLPGLRPDYAGYVVLRLLLPDAELPKFAAGQLVDSFLFPHRSESLTLPYLVPCATVCR